MQNNWRHKFSTFLCQQVEIVCLFIFKIKFSSFLLNNCQKMSLQLSLLLQGLYIRKFLKIMRINTQKCLVMKIFKKKKSIFLLVYNCKNKSKPHTNILFVVTLMMIFYCTHIQQYKYEFPSINASNVNYCLLNYEILLCVCYKYARKVLIIIVKRVAVCVWFVVLDIDDLCLYLNYFAK